MNSTVCKNMIDNRTLSHHSYILQNLVKKVDKNTHKIRNNKMALNFGHNELEENHIHDVKPLIALPYYALLFNNFQFKYTHGINQGVWLMPAAEATYIPRRDIITNGYIEPKNSQIELFAHTFDDDDNITNLTMRYVLVC